MVSVSNRIYSEISQKSNYTKPRTDIGKYIRRLCE